MAETDVQALRQRDHIDILLKEYETLRAEILNRINHRWQMLSVIGAILAFISTQRGTAFWLGWAIATFLGLLLLISARYIARLAEHISGIERRINALAGVEHLTWETIGTNRAIRSMRLSIF